MSEENLCFFALGSNMGDRLAHLKSGWEGMRNLGRLGSMRCSAIYETEPWGVARQAWFLNCVVELATEYKPLELLSRVKSLEHSAGRSTHLYRWGPRELDIDILLYGERIIRQEMLTIPHPRMTERRFVLAPLAELAAERSLPGLGMTVGGALAACADNSKVVRFQSGFTL